uniref:phosphoribulokinase n=2 Tax=Gammaproteobacteria TaxID=1236 RepID=Q0PQH5_9GAMM|nr:phosphoribulokinase [Candidatus Endoriftia persephone str. Hot96_1+Hot96_2]
MSKKHPIVAVTGSSGAGTTTVKRAFEHIFFRDGITPAVIEGDSFHRYDRAQMREKIAEGMSHFGPEANRFDKIEELFKTYGETGLGQKRYYLHSAEEAAEHNARLGIDKKPGEFTPWESVPEGTDLLFYEGLHGLAVDGDDDVAQHVDLGVGVVPIVNLEWIQKIFRDNAERGYTRGGNRRHHPGVACPTTSTTSRHSSRAPTSTSSAFPPWIHPTPLSPVISQLRSESFVVIRFKDPKKFDTDFRYLLSMIDGSFMSRRNSIVVPGGKMGFAMEIILQPIIEQMMDSRHV